MSVIVEPGDPRDPGAAALLAQSHQLMQRLYPSGSCHFLPIDALCAPNIAFFVARRAAETLGTAALADQGDYAEVKSMFVAPAARGTGTGAALLTRLEQEARAREFRLLRLETGPDLAAALHLYETHGFQRRGPFGGYVADPLSVFMEKRLD